MYSVLWTTQIQEQSHDITCMRVEPMLEDMYSYVLKLSLRIVNSSLYIGINVLCISAGHVSFRIQKYDSFSNKWYLFTALNSIRSSLDLCTMGYKGGIRGIVGFLPFLNLIHGIDPPSQSFSYIHEKLNQCS